ncbi:MAG: sigma 54-interacting transcriptional regulator [Firmicutes bacterium]|nr:sigma 54-interacting transcriptional regulator [Bacillota bacterium]
MRGSLLSTIADDVNQVAEAISLAVGCDVEVIDSSLIRIAATGSVKSTQGRPLRHGHGYSFILNHKRLLVMDEPGLHLICEPCDLKGRCYYKIGIAAPIVLEGESIGAIGIAAFEEKKRIRLKESLPELTGFIQKMADLLASKAREQRLLASLQETTAELTAILNASSEGIVAFDDQGQVLHHNNAALPLLCVKTTIEMEQAIKGILDRETRRLSRMSRQTAIGTRRIQIDLEPIPILGQKLWLLICRDYAAVRKSASAIALSDNSVSFDSILTVDDDMLKLLSIARKVAQSDSTVLISGESGTGKELLARAIHSQSRRRNGPFIPINCGAIPESLLESELFGYEPGAFTGARKDGKPGKFELADGGTLFLDEIGTMPLHLQVNLLRVIEDRKVERLGGTLATSTDVRIIAATNDDLEARVKEGRFRDDLYFRIKVIPLHIPPLRQRRGDIPLLADYFVHQYADRFGKQIDGIDEPVLTTLKSYDWPGNVRELSNVIEFAVNMEDTTCLTLDNLPASLRSVRSPTTPTSKLVDIKSDILTRYLEQFGWDKKGKIQTADALGVSLATIYRWLKRYGLKPSQKTILR